MRKLGSILSQRKQTTAHEILAEISFRRKSLVSSTMCVVRCRSVCDVVLKIRDSLHGASSAHHRKVLIIIYPARHSWWYKIEHRDDERLFGVVKKIENMWSVHKQLTSWRVHAFMFKLIRTQKLCPKLIFLLLVESRWIRVCGRLFHFIRTSLAPLFSMAYRPCHWHAHSAPFFLPENNKYATRTYNRRWSDCSAQRTAACIEQAHT